MAIGERKSSAQLRDEIRRNGAGKVYDAGGAILDADDLRNLILSLPPFDDAPSLLPPLGLAVFDATIAGRITLDDVTMPDGAAVRAVAFDRCIFEGGFSGARSRFSSLRFKNCRFRDRRTDNVPTIDLSGARLETGLYMVGLSPDGEKDYLWVRAPGLHIAGALDLSRSRLRAPPDHKETRLHCEPSIACFDLTKATVLGDVYALNGIRCEGCFHARGVHVQGNVWLGGATLEAPGSSALMLQRAIIDGSLMLNAPRERADGSGAVPAFICAGDLNLRAARIGGDVHLQSAFIAGAANFLDLEVRIDLVVNAAVRDEIDLTGCRVGGSVDLSGLLVGRSFRKLGMHAGVIGRALERRRKSSPPVLIAARRGFLKCIPTAELLETLWKEEGETDLYQFALIRAGGELYPLDGFASGFEMVFDKLDYELDTDLQAEEFLRLHGAHARGEAGFQIVFSPAMARALAIHSGSAADKALAALPPDFFRIDVTTRDGRKLITACVLHGDRLCQCEFMLAPGSGRIEIAKKHLVDGPVVDHVPMGRGPFLRHPPADEADLRAAIAARAWPTPAAVPRMVACDKSELADLRTVLIPQLAAAMDLRGEIDLSNLSCDMLDDGGGEGWGSLAHFDLNHFVYRHTVWRPIDHVPRPSQTVVVNLLTSRWVEWFGLPRGTKVPAREDYWADWQVRRNWLFQQFYRASDKPADPAAAPPEYEAKRIFSFRRIKDRHYRAQPFEQVIRVARAEGRESIATHFEILKRAIEWRIFNRYVRWWLAIPAIVLAASWLAMDQHDLLPTMAIWVALSLTIGAMIFGSAIRDFMFRLLGWFRRARESIPANRRYAKILTGFIYFVPAAALFWLLGYYERPFHFIVAFCIFASIRLITVIANRIYWLCFGYLRRPVRAIVTLIAAFILGWWGVAVANRHHMLVVNAEPVAPLAARATFPRPTSRNRTPQLVMGSLEVASVSPPFAHEVSCRPVISEPLYALDVLIPIVDLGEERRCEVRRLLDPALDRQEFDPATSGWSPGTSGPGELFANIPRMTIENHRFWWWMKSLYAIAGWFIVSLSILTFAQVNRAHAEPPAESR
jgi:hypothetical protein